MNMIAKHFLNFELLQDNETMESSSLETSSVKWKEMGISTKEFQITDVNTRKEAEKRIDALLNSELKGKESIVISDLLNTFKEGGTFSDQEVGVYKYWVRGEFLKNTDGLNTLAKTLWTTYNKNATTMVRTRLNQLGYHGANGETISASGPVDRNFLFAVAEFQLTCSLYETGAKQEYNGSSKIDCIPGKVTLEALLNENNACPTKGSLSLAETIKIGEELKNHYKNIAASVMFPGTEKAKNQEKEKNTPVPASKEKPAADKPEEWKKSTLDRDKEMEAVEKTEEGKAMKEILIKSIENWIDRGNTGLSIAKNSDGTPSISFKVGIINIWLIKGNDQGTISIAKNRNWEALNAKVGNENFEFTLDKTAGKIKVNKISDSATIEESSTKDLTPTQKIETVEPANKIVAPEDAKPSQVEINTTIEGGMLEYDSSKINNISKKQVNEIDGEFKKTEKGLTKIQTLAETLTWYTKTYSENLAVRTSIKDQLTARGSVHPETEPQFDEKENITNKKEIINIDPSKKEVIENYENAGDAMKKSSKSIGRIIDEGGKWDRKEINIDTNAINNSTEKAINEVEVFINYTLSNSTNSSNIQSQTTDLLSKDSDKQNTLSTSIEERIAELPTTSFNDKPKKILEIDGLKGSHDDLFSTTQDTLQKQNNTIKKVYGNGIDELQTIDKALETKYLNIKKSRDTLDNTRKVLDTQGTTYDKDDRSGDKLIPTIQKMDEILTNLQTSRDSLKSKVDEFTVQLGKENIATKVLNVQNNYVDTKIGARKLILEKDQKTREKVEVEKGLEVFTNLFEWKTTLKGEKLTMENINNELIELTAAKKASDTQYEQAKTANNNDLRDSSEVKSRELQQTILVYTEYAKGSENYQGLKTKQTTLTQEINTLNGQIDTKAQNLKSLEKQITTERANIQGDTQTTIDPNPSTESFKFEPDKDKIPAYWLEEQKTVESADNQEYAQLDIDPNLEPDNFKNPISDF